MWFAKLFEFGGRNDDSEPSEHPPHPVAHAKAVPNNVRTISKSGIKKPAAAGKGFDPYNSGSFDKNKAWEKVIR